MKKNIFFYFIIVALLTEACNTAFLEPKPLSIYTPENTYVDYNGLMSAIAACETSLMDKYFGAGAPILTEEFCSDVAIHGKTDDSDALCDFDLQLTPITTYDNSKNNIGWFWTANYAGVKYANIVLNRMSAATFKSEAEENEIRGIALFQRAIRYYNLVHQFGDVPWIDHEIETPETNFNTYDRWSILGQLEKDLQFSWKWMKDGVDLGRSAKSAAGILYMKIAIELGHYDEAISVGQEIVDAHPLMTEMYTSEKGKKNHENLMCDMFSREGKQSSANTERIYVVYSAPFLEGGIRSATMRNATPLWSKVPDPNGKNGCQQIPADEDLNTIYDNNANVGRGNGLLRPSNYYQYDIWGPKEANDLRSPNNPYSWRHMEDLYYNKPSSKYYRKHLIRPKNMAVGDSIRWWYSWPHYKLYTADEEAAAGDDRGGHTPWYVARSAEAWQVMAEAWYWKGNMDKVAENLNVVRRRAGAEDLTAAECGIAAILDERARELYYEEDRHTELVRIAYTFARSGKPCEATGYTYKLDNICGPDTFGTYIKDHGYNFFFDWVVDHNNFYNKGVKNAYNEYRMSVFHMLWPIPEEAITSNTGGIINQNVGYAKVKKNIVPLKIEE